MGGQRYCIRSRRPDLFCLGPEREGLPDVAGDQARASSRLGLILANNGRASSIHGVVCHPVLWRPGTARVLP